MLSLIILIAGLIGISIKSYFGTQALISIILIVFGSIGVLFQIIFIIVGMCIAGSAANDVGTRHRKRR